MLQVSWIWTRSPTFSFPTYVPCQLCLIQHSLSSQPYKIIFIILGKKKQEKRLEAMERTNKAHNLLHEVGERGTMKSLLLAQEATGKAHVTIQGGTSAASTSISAAQLLAARNKKSKNNSSSSSSGAQISKSSSSKTAGKPPHK